MILNNNNCLPYPGIVRLRVVDHQLAGGPGAADGDPGVVSTWLGVCSTDTALSIHLMSCGGGPTHVEGFCVDEEAVVELTLGVTGDFNHLALSCWGVSLSDGRGAHCAALQQCFMTLL